MSKLEIIVASTRPGRVGPSVAHWIESEATRHGGFDAIEVVDLAEVNLPFMNEPHHPRLGRYTHQHTRDWSAKVAEADAFVFVMPEYNYGYNAELKNALDYLHGEWQYKPVGLVSYGGVSGGTRAVQMIKQVVTTLKMTPVVEAVSIPFVHQLLDEDRRLLPNDVMTGSAKAMLDELVRFAEALRPLRAPAAP
ncbi:NAD(P)H-dependent FMN reductase [Streptomyces sp. B3I7]|jgi:NAD(P)H-dependent FMN reductase|uniref:NADPH-dependent FMN reductase n=1 Tax=unclassified Streptomyces TaxID=2593676 RepID=UPI002784B1B0|nr:MULTISPECIES: NAD(P)H-dependent oxidoreductase [unclassified Streptomyces]MDQ0790596.1 NAD(P)H-dependent FMN reductase [Streptomyces sp. B3I8]MDQ0809666.1 NAD(P)H-dependent FMN reductase [Streptomyces sp. B3I7]